MSYEKLLKKTYKEEENHNELSNIGRRTYMWMAINAGGNVDDRVAAEHNLLAWPGQAGEGQGGVPHHAVAERSCRLYK